MAAVADVEAFEASKDTASQNPSFRQLAFIVGVVLILGAWKFGLEGLMD